MLMKSVKTYCEEFIKRRIRASPGPGRVRPHSAPATRVWPQPTDESIPPISKGIIHAPTHLSQRYEENQEEYMDEARWKVPINFLSGGGRRGEGEGKEGER